MGLNGLSVRQARGCCQLLSDHLGHGRDISSWLGLGPGNTICGGKVLSSKTKGSVNRVHQVLKMAAMSLSRCDSALGAYDRRLCARMDKPSANTAVAHKLARMVYFMLTRGEAFVDKGQQHYQELPLARSVAALKRRATVLGFAITPVSTGDDRISARKKTGPKSPSDFRAGAFFASTRRASVLPPA